MHDRAPGAMEGQQTASTRHRAAQPAARMRTEPVRGPLPVSSSTGVLDLQPLAGNRAVAGAVQQMARDSLAQRGLQRVPVKYSPPNETLYNQAAAGGQASARQYGGAVAYDMNRNGDAGVTVTVRIQFLNQSRNGIDPSSPGAPPGTPRLGALIGAPTEIPATDPDNRRTWCQNIVTEQVKPWNGKLTFVGEEVNVLRANTPKRLPVTFRAVAVFGLADPYDKRIIVHPVATQANPATGNPIDAGNYYLNQGNYSADEKVIAAHEYGHLLGIDDEYSQSNDMLNSLLHQAAPRTAPSSMAAVDRETVKRMVLAGLMRPLQARLLATMPAVTDAFRSQRDLVKRQMAAAARAGVMDPAVRAELVANLTASSQATVGARVPSVVAFQTTTNFSNVTAARAGVEAGFDAAALSTQIGTAYRAALGAARRASVTIPGVGATTITVHPSVEAMTAAGGAQEARAAGMASTVVGSAGGPVNFLGLPLIAPASGLVGQLMALPAAWSTAGSVLETGVTPAALAAKMVSVVRAVSAAAAAPLPPGAVATQPSGRVSVLYRRAHDLVLRTVTEACRQLSIDLVGAVVPPALTASVTALGSTIETEVTRVMTTPPSGVAALGPPDPNMAALVAHMKAQLAADKAASAGGGRSPLGTGKPAPDQHVTYSVQGLMGSSANTSIRADQFNPMVRQFNSRLTTMWEKDFRSEVK